jgi:hypothetical protein
LGQVLLLLQIICNGSTESCVYAHGTNKQASQEVYLIMEPTNNPGASAPPQPQDDLGQTRYFPPVGQGETPTQGPKQEVPTGAYQQGSAGYTQGQAPVPPQGPGHQQQPGYPPYGQWSGQQGAPNGQPGQYGHPAHHYGPQNGQWQWQWPASANNDRNRAFWGMILVGAGILFLIDQLFSFQGFGSFFLLAIGGAFMYAYFNKNRWAVIPGSILLGLGAGALLEELDFMNFWGGGVVAFTLGLGFCLIWFLERRHWWALIPGGILVLAGLSSNLVVGRFWPVLLIGLGLYLLFEQSRRKAPR